jgi:hypothetical protein
MKSIGLIAYIALVSAETSTITETTAKHPVDYNSYPVKVVVAPTISTLPHTQKDHPVVITTKHWPDEMEWTLTGSGPAAGVSCKGGPYNGHYGPQPAEPCALKAGSYTLKCIDTYGDGWHGGFMTVDGVMYCDDFTTGHLMTKTFDECADPLDITQKELDVQLDYFSRNFDKFHYENAMNIYAEMKKKGQDPVTGESGVHTWELYDKAFPFEKVRRYDLVQQHMDSIQHFQDNLNQNLQNGQAVDQFIIVGLAAEAALNAKYHNGEFTDPALFDPVDAHPVTWATAKFGN